MIDWAAITLRDCAGYISEELKKNGIETVLVGGACVSIYSNNRYLSYELGYITYDEMKKVKKALSELGFLEKQKYFKRADCPWFIEFVSPPIAIGNEPIYEFNILKTSLGTIKLLKPVDSVRDRLASFYHWNDKQALEQAVSICQEQTVNLEDVKQWSIQEDEMDKFEIFLAKLSS